MSKTIKELADALGVSKTAIRNYMNDDFRAKYTAKDAKGVITITPDGCKVISENFDKQAENTGKNSVETELLTIPRSVWQLMEDQLRVKDEQLKARDQEIAELTKLVDQAQRLHAGTIQQTLPEGADESVPSEPVATVETVPEPSDKPKRKGLLSWLWN